MPNKVVSVYNLELSGDQGMNGGGAGGVGTTEQRIYQEFESSVPWDAMPGTNLRGGLAGKWIAGANPVTLRVRVGDGTDNALTNYLLGGAVAFEKTIPANSTVEFGEVATYTTPKPSGNKAWTKFMVSAFAVGGSSSLNWSDAVASIYPDDGYGQGLYLHTNGVDVAGVGGGSTEQLGYEWAVDFDQFENVQNLLIAFAGQLDAGGGGTFRVRVGGTAGAAFGTLSPDGTVVLTWNSTGGVVPTAGARATGGLVQTVAKAGLSGVQPVKITAQNYGGATRIGLVIQEEH